MPWWGWVLVAPLALIGAYVAAEIILAYQYQSREHRAVDDCDGPSWP